MNIIFTIIITVDGTGKVEVNNFEDISKLKSYVKLVIKGVLTNGNYYINIRIENGVSVAFNLTILCKILKCIDK